MTDNRKPIPANALDVFSNWIYAEPTAGATKRPSLRLQVIKNVPRFSVKTQVPNDKNNGRIDFNCDLPTFSVIMHKLGELATGKTTTAFNFNFIDHIYPGGQRSEKPMVISTLRIGVDEDSGRIYISILAHNRPRIQFFFGPSKFHAMTTGNGAEVKPGDLSAAYAMGFIKAYTPLVVNLLVSCFDPEAKNVPKPFTGQPAQNTPNNSNTTSYASKPKENFEDEEVESLDDLFF